VCDAVEQNFPAGAVSISKLPWLQMLRQEPSVVFRLQSSRLTMQAESSNTIYTGGQPY
jgi:hypothetical protein